MGKIAIYGAGQAGRMVMKWLPGHQEAVCFLDRDPAKQGKTADGVPVRAPEELTAAEWESLTEVVIAVMKREAAEEITADLRGLCLESHTADSESLVREREREPSAT